MNKREEEYKKIEATLEELDSETEEKFDNLSDVKCDCCGKRLSVDEWEEFESMCMECVWEATSGLIDDTNEEL